MTTARLLPWTLLAMALLVAGVYWRVLANGFVSYDDLQYVTENPQVKAGLTLSGLAWAFTTEHAANWHPLTWLSHMLDVQLFGLTPAGHHATSLLLHIASTLLICTFLHRTTGKLWQSCAVALLFALHPMHVESVAWVAERKDVLSTLLMLLTMWGYLWYTRRPGPARYLVVLLTFLLGLMAKPMLVTLPLILLVLDYWPLARLRFSAPADEIRLPAFLLVVEKFPLLALALVSAIITFYVQQKGLAMDPLTGHDLLLNAGNAVISYGVYILKLLWPTKLAVIYPFNVDLITAPRVIASALALCAVTFGAMRIARSHPYVLAGWLWYLITLVPVIGFIRVGSQAMADRYTYVPALGLFVVVCFGLPELAARLRLPRLLPAVLATAAVIACSVLTHIQIGYWQNGVVLLQHAVDVTSNNAVAHSNLGVAYAKRGNLAAAMGHFQEAVRIDPTYADGYNNLGNVYYSLGNLHQAMAVYLQAIKLVPWNADAHLNLGRCYYLQGDLDQAQAEYRLLTRIAPESARVLADLLARPPAPQP